MFRNLAYVAAMSLKVMIPDGHSVQDVIGNRTNIEVEVDSSLAKDQYNVLIGEMKISGASKELLKEIINGSSNISNVPKEMKEIINELSMKKKDLVSDLKSGAFNFATIFTNDPEFSKVFKELEKIKGIYLFHSSSKEEADNLGVSFPGVLGFNSEDSNVLILPFHNNIDAVVSAISIPAFSPINQENYKYLQTLEQRLFYVIDNTGSFEENKAKFNSAAKQCSSFAKFIYFTPEDVPALMPLLNVKEGDFPILLSLAGDGKGIVRGVKPEGFLGGVQSLITQTAEKLVFSSTIPEDNESRDVKVLNTASLPLAFSNGEKDVLVSFTSPTCQYCQMLEPELAKFSKILSENNVPIFVGNYNIMENEEPANYKITGVPTIYFLKKGASTAIKVPSDVRNLAQLLDFVSKEGETSKINLENYSEHLKAKEAEQEAEVSEEDSEEKVEEKEDEKAKETL